MSEQSGASEYVIGSGAVGASKADEKSQAGGAGGAAEAATGERGEAGAAAEAATGERGAAGAAAGERGAAGAAAEAGGGRINTIIKAADALSLGLSMVVAVLIGVGLGVWLSGFYKPLLWVGVAFGVAAAVNNVYKAYRRLLAMDAACEISTPETGAKSPTPSENPLFSQNPAHSQAASARSADTEHPKAANERKN